MSNGVNFRTLCIDLRGQLDRVTAERDSALGREAALREELENHDSASKLMNAWVAEKGQIPWVTAINIVAIITKMPDEERQRLIDMDDGSTERGALIAKIDALQQRLTAADERAGVLEGLLREVSAEARHPDYDWNLETQRAIDAALKPAEPAKCERCGCSTVENCDERGCGYLGAGNGAPE